MTRVLLGHGLCIFLMALCRLCMLLLGKFHQAWNPAMIDWCFTLQTGQIWAIGMGNTFNAIMSLAYFRLIRKACVGDLRLYQIGSDAAAKYIFLLLLLFCTVSTGVCMSYAGAFLVNRNYCLAVGASYENNELFSLWLALGVCVPSLFAFGCFIAGATYFALLKHKYKNRELTLATSGGMGTALAHLNNIQTALQYLIISWFCTNFLDVF